MTDFTYKGEAMLFSWSDSSAGRKVTFLLPDEGQHHPFRGYKCGPSYGQSFAIGCKPVVVGESEPEPEKPKRDMKESQRCAMYCRDERFQEWLSKQYSHFWLPKADKGIDPEEIAAWIIRKVLMIGSRGGLDFDEQARHGWHALLSQYRQETGLEPQRTK